MGVMMLLGLAFSNPAILLTLFILAAVVLYTFSSYRFLRIGIDKGQILKKSKRDFIKVNAYVAMIFAVMNFVQSLTVMLDPKFLNDMLKQIDQIQQSAGSTSAAHLASIIKIVLWVFLFYAVALGTHIFISFQLLKKYSGLFSDIHTEHKP
jgi:hypothetical protein